MISLTIITYLLISFGTALRLNSRLDKKYSKINYMLVGLCWPGVLMINIGSALDKFSAWVSE